MRLLLWDDTRLGQAPTRRTDDLSDDQLARAYHPPGPVWVRGNMVSTVDGAAVDAHGVSGGINTPADQRTFGLLRAFADVVLIGAGTARMEGYSRIAVDAGWQSVRRAAGLRPAPALAVVTDSGELPDSVLVEQHNAGELLLFAGPHTPAAAVAALQRRLGGDRIVSATDGPLTPDRILDALAGRGLTRVLLEGGPSLLHEVVVAGRLDELCLTWSPLLLGGPSGRILAGQPLGIGLHPACLLEEDGTLLGRWLIH